MGIVTPNEQKRMALRTRTTEEEVLTWVQEAMLNGTLLANYQTNNPNLSAGGTNFCPNSDLSWSHLAATVPGTSPGDATDDNKRCYRVFRQAVGADISATGLRVAGGGSGEESTVYIPVWDLPYGVARIGADDIANNYDIAFKFDNNWVVPAKTWYIRVACATVGATPPPAGMRLFAGFWVDDGVAQDWIRDTAFPITVERLDVADTGGITYEYKVIARTDSNTEIESNVLSVTNVGTLSATNRLRIEFYGAFGYLEFETYRRNTVTGQVDLIDFQRNSSNLSVVDQGQSIRIAPAGFPTGFETDTRAYAEVAINALPITQQKTFNDFTIRIPNYDTSALLSEGTYLRIGLTSDVPCAIDRQIMVDTIWASESFNRWTPSPNDGYGSLPTAAVTTGVGTGQSSTPAPSGGGSSCVDVKYDLLLNKDENQSTPLSTAIEGLTIHSGVGTNTIDHFVRGEVSQYLRIVFSHGLVIRCTPSHRFIRSFEDGTGIQAMSIVVGDTFMGVRKGEDIRVRVKSVKMVQGALKVMATKVGEGKGNLYYAVGDGESGLYAYAHNLKSPDDLDLEIS